MKKSRIISIVLLCVLLGGILSGCGEFMPEQGYFVTMRDGNKNISLMQLSESGKEQEIIVIPLTLGGVKVSWVGMSGWAGRFWESDKLKRIYFPFGSTRNVHDHVFDAVPSLEKIFFIENYVHANSISLSSPHYKIMHSNYLFHNDFSDSYYKDTFAPANISYYYNYPDAPNDNYYWIDDWNYGGLIEYQPEDPTREGYTFGGWYKEAECINPWDYETDTLPELMLDEDEEAVYQETILYAKWEGADCENPYGIFSTGNNEATVYHYYGNDTALIIPDTIEGHTVTGIAQSAFSGTESLTSVTIPAAVTFIGAGAFKDCTNLASVTFAPGSQLTSIGGGAFEGCSALTGITIPAGVTSIGYGAFKDASSLMTINIPAGVTDLGYYAFSGTDSLTAITVEGNNPYYVSVDGNLFDRSGYLIRYSAGKTETSYTVPATVSGAVVRQIFSYAFEGADSLVSVNLNQIVLVNDYAFAGCVNLTTVAGTEHVEFIAPGALQDSPVAADADGFVILGRVLYEYKGTAEVVEVPAQADMINTGAFALNDTVREVHLFATNYIGDKAFLLCENLEKVQLTGRVDLPRTAGDAFFGLDEDFAFYCARSAKEQMDDGITGKDWAQYQDVAEAIKTEVYFSDADRTATYYYGEVVPAPPVEIPGYNILGWYLAGENNARGEKLPAGIWMKTDAALTYYAELQRYTTYALSFRNGPGNAQDSYQLGVIRLEINEGDNVSIKLFESGYSINGGPVIPFLYAEKMNDYFYNGVYGDNTPNNSGDVVCILVGWEINGSLLPSNTWTAAYGAGVIRAVWAPVEHNLSA